MNREEYEKSTHALRENMREALAAKRKYVIGEEGESIEEKGPEDGKDSEETGE